MVLDRTIIAFKCVIAQLGAKLRKFSQFTRDLMHLTHFICPLEQFKPIYTRPSALYIILRNFTYILTIKYVILRISAAKPYLGRARTTKAR